VNIDHSFNSGIYCADWLIFQCLPFGSSQSRRPVSGKNKEANGYEFSIRECMDETLSFEWFVPFLSLTLNGMNILEWFRQKFQEMRQTIYFDFITYLI
jgi:hypothetical protein